MKNSRILLFLLCSFIPFCLFSQITLVRNGKPQSRIIANLDNETDRQAVELFQHFVKQISGAELPLLPASTKPKKGDVLIGDFQLPLSHVDASLIKEDGFFLSTADGFLRVVGSKGKGTAYGLITVLEDYFGIRYYAAHAYTFDVQKDLSLPLVSRIENPSFSYRQTQGYSIQSDSVFKLWHRLEEPNEVFAGGYWVHTFDRLLPSARYGKSHPEYYALINGERRPGWASQLCLTNPDVFEIVAARIDSIFKANPDKKMISVSQNDGHDTYCTCPLCTALNEKEGSLSGSIIHFVNKLAERFPDKEFSTLAYMYSVPPPKHVRPLPNVNIMLCDIECTREVTLPENEVGRQFVDEMEAWAKISNNIFVWDYGIDFDSYLSPFPNFHILKPNMELFEKNKTSMHFSQIAGGKGGDFSELRTYLVSKLMWNTSLDADSLMQQFLKGYYGEAAAPYLYEYIKLREGALIGSNIPLKLYDTPVSHKTGMLNPPMLKRYIELFDRAEVASKNNNLFHKRVKECRLPIQYSELEIAHTYPITNYETLRQKLNFFRQRANELDVSILNEQSARIDDYCDLYEKRYLTKNDQNLAKGAKVSFSLLPDTPFNFDPEVTLTDGILGAAATGKEWIGWQGQDGEFTIDLGETKSIRGVGLDFLQRLGSWAILPKAASWSASTDNKNFEEGGETQIPEDRDFRAKFVRVEIPSTQKIKARYIQVHIKTIGLCPPWHLAVGHPAWFLLDEVEVY